MYTGWKMLLYLEYFTFTNPMPPTSLISSHFSLYFPYPTPFIFSPSVWVTLRVFLSRLRSFVVHTTVQCFFLLFYFPLLSVCYSWILFTTVIVWLHRAVPLRIKWYNHLHNSFIIIIINSIIEGEDTFTQNPMKIEGQ